MALRLRHASLLALFAVLAQTGTAGAGGIEPQISYSVALGKSGTRWFGHMWAGGGVHIASGLFVLAGVAGEIRDRPDSKVSPRLQAIDPGGVEAWIAVRTGIGHFERGGLAPKVAVYTITGYLVAGASVAPRLRIGAGLSVPAALPLAEIGIPTMIELGADAGGELGVVRLFLRAGWNF